MHSTYTNEVTDCLKTAGISNFHLITSLKQRKSACFASMLKILGFHNNGMENGSQVVLKRRINMIRVVTLLDLQSKQR